MLEYHGSVEDLIRDFSKHNYVSSVCLFSILVLSTNDVDVITDDSS